MSSLLVVTFLFILVLPFFHEYLSALFHTPDSRLWTKLSQELDYKAQLRSSFCFLHNYCACLQPLQNVAGCSLHQVFKLLEWRHVTKIGSEEEPRELKFIRSSTVLAFWVQCLGGLKKSENFSFLPEILLTSCRFAKYWYDFPEYCQDIKVST